MPIFFYPSDGSHPDQWEVRPPEAYLLIQATEDNVLTPFVRLAFLLDMPRTAPVVRRGRNRYKMQSPSATAIAEDPELAEDEEFWVGASIQTGTWLRILRDVDRLGGGVQQRALLNRCAGILGIPASDIDGIQAISVAESGK